MPLLLLPCRSISSFYSIQSEMHAHIGNKICRSNLFALSHCRCNEHVRASAITRISCSKKNTFLIWLLHICSILRGIFTFCEMTPIWRYLNAFNDLLAGQWTCTSCIWNRRTRAYWETTSKSLLRYLWPILSQIVHHTYATISSKTCACSVDEPKSGWKLWCIMTKTLLTSMCKECRFEHVK